jgi:ATP-dependent DNA helicase RecQ
LAYFGQDSGDCGNCDTCLQPAESWDGTIAAQKVLSTVYRLHTERRQHFGAGHIVDIVTGRLTPRVEQFRHQELSVFGVGADLDAVGWRAVIRQLLAQGYLAVESDHGTLGLTARSREVLFANTPVLLRRDPERKRPSRTRSAKKAVELPEQAAPLFERLRSWRAATAREQGIPAYVIFHDATLREIATRRPEDLSGLAGISGVGEAKLARYGEQILAALQQDG